MRAHGSACVGALMLFATTAFGAEPGFYFGASAGQAKYDFDLPAQIAFVGVLPPVTPILNPPVFNPGPIVGGVTAIAARPVLWLPGEDDEGTSWSLSAGYRISRYFAVEASYVNLGTLDARHTVVVPPILGGGTVAFHRELETEGPALAVTGILPISDSWELYVRAGMFFAESELTTSINGTSISTDYDSDSTTLGAGAQFGWGGHWSARLEFQRSRDIGGDEVAGDASVDGVSLGVIYRL